MLKKALAAAALAGLSGTALAHPPHWAPAYGYRAHHYYRPYVRYYYRPAPVVIPASRIVVRLRLPQPTACRRSSFGSTARRTTRTAWRRSQSAA